MQDPRKACHAHLDAFSAYLREHGMEPIQFISMHCGENYWTVVFRTNYCPLCKRSHERQNNFLKQYKRGERSLAPGEPDGPPKSYLGCYQAEYPQNSFRVHPWIYIGNLWDLQTSEFLKSWGVKFNKASDLWPNDSNQVIN